MHMILHKATLLALLSSWLSLLLWENYIYSIVLTNISIIIIVVIVDTIIVYYDYFVSLSYYHVLSILMITVANVMMISICLLHI